MSDSVSVDYEAVLSDLRAKRERLDAAISGIEAMLGIRGLAGSTPKPAEQASPSASLGPGAYLGMTIVDAAKKYLAHKRQSQRTEEILNALVEGGLVLTGEKPINVVGSVLNRNFNSGGEIVKVARGVWGLASWHPRLKKKNGDSAAKAGSTDEAEAAEDAPSENSASIFDVKMQEAQR